MELKGINFKTDFKYILHIILIALALGIGVLPFYNQLYTIHPYFIFFVIFAVIYILDNVLEKYLGV